MLGSSFQQQPGWLALQQGDGLGKGIIAPSASPSAKSKAGTAALNPSQQLLAELGKSQHGWSLVLPPAWDQVPVVAVGSDWDPHAVVRDDEGLCLGFSGAGGIEILPGLG